MNTNTNTETAPRPIHVIAREIRQDWGAKINYAAKPYLDAMQGLTSIRESYGYDSARSVVLYFLSNAKTYRGETAKRLKLELKGLLK